MRTGVVTYTVYEPPYASANRLESAEQLVFVKDTYTIIAALLRIGMTMETSGVALMRYRRPKCRMKSGRQDQRHARQSETGVDQLEA